jgi:hypothetical protein
MLGRKFADPELQARMKKYPFKVVEGKNKEPLVEVPLTLSIFYPSYPVAPSSCALTSLAPPFNHTLVSFFLVPPFLTSPTPQVTFKTKKAQFSAVDLAGIILKDMKTFATHFLGE